MYVIFNIFKKPGLIDTEKRLVIAREVEGGG